MGEDCVSPGREGRDVFRMKRSDIKKPFYAERLFYVFINYACLIASTGHTPAQVPQSVHVFGSIS